ncbi:MAG: F-type H+-transporting ATPase subunit gamma [Candidatus Azotimanducaceae bacterium]|jgi:F-type H+-transporting ATPase subunit gamma
MALKQVKNKIISTLKTGKVTKAMESVSAVKMRKSQERALSGKFYAEAAMRILTRISKSTDADLFMTQEPQKDAKSCFVVMTSDKGLAGALNSSVLKSVTIAIAALPKEDVRIIAFGRKAVEHFKRREYVLDGEYTNVADTVSVDDMKDVMGIVTKAFNSGEYKTVSIVYQNFVSTFEQNALLRQILPLDTNILETMVRDIVPKKGKFSEIESESNGHVYTVEPSPEEVLTALIPQLVQIMLYHAMLENKASEHSARMVAMKNATDKSKEVAKALTLVYNKERQAAITAEVSEITGGIAAMEN